MSATTGDATVPLDRPSGIDRNVSALTTAETFRPIRSTPSSGTFRGWQAPGMPLFSIDGLGPTVHPDAFVAPTATLVGDVRVEAGASVWYNAVLRADLGAIIVRAGANVQDGSVLHGGDDPVTEIGEGATIGHLCVVHGAVIGPRALIGNGTTVQDGARIGEGAMVAAGSTVAPNTELAADRLMLGSAAKEKGPLTEGARWWVRHNPDFYQQLARRHAAGIAPVEDGAPGANR